MIVHKLYRLDYFEEATGTVHKVCKDDGKIVLRIGNLSVVLPAAMEDEMRANIGTRISVLHTDIPQKEYLVRVIQ